MGIIIYNTHQKKILDIIDHEKIDQSILNSCNFGYQYIAPKIDNKTKNILELGSGSCLLMSHLTYKFKKKKFTGVDPDLQGFQIFQNLKQKLIQKFKLKIYNNINELKTKHKFDLIFSIDVLEHVKDIEDLILKSKNKLSNNGKIIIICPNYTFPYEPHFNIPIIINKKITFKIFKNKILNDEKKNNSEGLWKSLNFITAKKLENIAFNNSMKINFFSEVSQNLLIRVAEDSNFKRRKYISWVLAYLCVKILFLKRIKFKFFMKYLPYIQAEITLK